LQLALSKNTEKSRKLENIKISEKPNREKKPIKQIKILKKPADSVWFWFSKPKTEKTKPNRTEPNPNQKNRTEPNPNRKQTEPNWKKTEPNQKIRVKLI
jgi:hypothetical protein